MPSGLKAIARTLPACPSSATGCAVVRRSQTRMVVSSAVDAKWLPSTLNAMTELPACWTIRLAPPEAIGQIFTESSAADASCRPSGLNRICTTSWLPANVTRRRPDVRSHTSMTPLLDPAAMRVPSSLNAAQVASLGSPVSVATTRWVSGSTSWRVRSEAAPFMTASLPSAAKASSRGDKATVDEPRVVRIRIPHVHRAFRAQHAAAARRRSRRARKLGPEEVCRGP